MRRGTKRPADAKSECAGGIHSRKISRPATLSSLFTIPKRRWRPLAVAVLASVFGAGPAPAGPRPEPAAFVSALEAGEPRTIVVYGTSLTANGGWVGQMRAWLAAQYPGAATVINSGLSGRNSAEGLARLEARVLDHEPDVVFIEFAMNDAFRYTDGTPRLDVPQARENLEAMIRAIRERNPDVEILLQTTNTVWDSPAGSNRSATLRPELAAYYRMYREVAAARGLMLIDHEANWAALQREDRAKFEAFIPDGVHPTAAGCAEVVFPFLQRQLAGGDPAG